MNTYWTGGMSVEPAHHDGDEPWYEETLVSVAGRLFPPRFRISLRCTATEIEMCTAVEVEQGGFIEPNNAISVTGLSSGVEKDYFRAAARKLALPLALATMPEDTFEQSSHGWKWGVDGWSPGSTMRTGLADSGQIALLEELRRRCGPKWWSIYLPRIEKTAEIVWEAPTDWSRWSVLPHTWDGHRRTPTCRLPERSDSCHPMRI